MSNEIKNILSYNDIIASRDKFLGRVKGSTGFIKDGDPRMRYDEPLVVYFRLFFYFNNSYGENRQSDRSNGLPFSNNLLGLDNDFERLSATPSATSTDGYSAFVGANTAYNFLLANDEIERAEYLKQFIYLLSEINTNSPWYWQSISGLDGAIEQKWIEDGKMNEDKSITITCLPDAIDGRISTLLDLYRSATYSNQRMVSIVPANLRKFDMGVYVFATTNSNIHKLKSGKYATIDPNPTNSNEFIASSKYFEFHNCEINYNTSKDAFTEISNVDGSELVHKLVINYDECMTMNYNQFMMKTIGDLVTTDLSGIYAYDKSNIRQNDNFRLSQQAYTNNIESELPQQNLTDNINKIKGGFITRLVNQASNTLDTYAKSLITKLYLGNAHGFSMKSAVNIADQMLNGSVIDATKNLISQSNNNKNKNQDTEILQAQAHTVNIPPIQSNDLGLRSKGIINPTL